MIIKNNIFTEENYEGYGVFGGKDFFELLAKMNGQKPDRHIGIDLYHLDNEKILFPNLVENHKNRKWKNMKPEDCKNQGYFYDE